MKNIHILPTDKPSRFFIYNGELGLAKGYQYGSDAIQNQNIYITSDEEIKDGDYYLYLKDNKVYKFIKRDHTRLTALHIQKKIILTTDQDLIKNGIQAIDDEFLEWFVKNASCEEVKVDKAEHGIYKDDVYYKLSNKIFYKIIIPKEEKTKCYCGHTTTCDCGPEELEILETPMPIYNQETLEEAAERLNPYVLNGRTPFKEGLYQGAKWHAERSYSEEEVMDMFHNLSMHLPLHYEFLVNEQFKKK